jgi:hypothetical protein
VRASTLRSWFVLEGRIGGAGAAPPLLLYIYGGSSRVVPRVRGPASHSSVTTKVSVGNRLASSVADLPAHSRPASHALRLTTCVSRPASLFFFFFVTYVVGYREWYRGGGIATPLPRVKYEGVGDRGRSLSSRPIFLPFQTCGMDSRWGV